MNRFITRTAVVVGTLVMWASMAQAAPVIIMDKLDVAATNMGNAYSGYSSPTFANQLRNGRYWGDSIQDMVEPFDTSQVAISVTRSINRMDIDITTRFDGTDGPANYADIFIDTNSPGTLNNFNYAIALGDQLADGGKAAGVYAVTSSQTSNDIWGGRSGWVYGGFVQFKTTSSNYDPLMAMAAPVRVTGGALQSQYTVTVTQTDAGGGFFNLNVAIVSSTNLSLFDNFDLFWGTGDCSNDAIWGSVSTTDVPAPGALVLLGFGLFGIGVMRRKLKTAA